MALVEVDPLHAGWWFRPICRFGGSQRCPSYPAPAPTRAWPVELCQLWLRLPQKYKMKKALALAPSLSSLRKARGNSSFGLRIYIFWLWLAGGNYIFIWLVTGRKWRNSSGVKMVYLQLKVFSVLNWHFFANWRHYRKPSIANKPF